MMDLSILVFFQRWLIDRNNEMNCHYMSDRKYESSPNGHPPKDSVTIQDGIENFA